MMDNYFAGVSKLCLMIVISLGLYIFLKDLSLSLLSEKEVKSFILDLAKDNFKITRSQFTIYYNLINSTCRIAFLSLFVYTVIHGCFKFLDVKSSIYLLVAYTVQQTTYIYQYIEIPKTTERINDLAMNNVLYSSIGAILAFFIFLMITRRTSSIV